MQVDDKLEGDPIRNLWAAVIMTALDDLKIGYDANPKWSSGISRQLDRKKAIWFFSEPYESSLSWICEKLNIDLIATVKKAHEICPEVKINLSFEQVESYYKGEFKKVAQG
jgi:hypothetical protein